MAEMNKVCKICGNDFISTCHNKAYCSEDCMIHGRRNLERLRKMKRKKQSNSVVDIAIEARKHGMSYGQYVALKGL